MRLVKAAKPSPDAKFHNLSTAYNDRYRILHNLPPWTRARLSQIECHINTYKAILRKTIAFQRCQRTSYNLINSLMISGCFFESNFFLITTTCFHNFQLPLVTETTDARVFLCFYSAIFQLTSAKFQTLAYNSRTVGSSYMKF